MKKYQLYILSLFFFGPGFSMALKGQQRMQYSQYLNNAFLLNPALTGVEDYLDLKIGYSQQWAGFDGAPRGIFFTAHKATIPEAKMTTSKQVTSLPAPGRGRYFPTTAQIETSPTKSPKGIRLGLGGSLFSEQTGPISYTGLSGAFSVNLPLGNDWRLALGVNLELMNYRVDPSGISLTEENDVAVVQSRTSLFLPSLNAGMALFNRNFFIAGSSRQLLRNRVQLNLANPFVSTLEIHLLAQAGFRFHLSDEFLLIPSLALRSAGPAPPSWEIGLRTDYKDMFFLGLSYRHQDAIVALLGFNLNHWLALNYSYDFTTSSLRNQSSGSHGITLAMRLMNKQNRTRKYFW